MKTGPVAPPAVKANGSAYTPAAPSNNELDPSPPSAERGGFFAAVSLLLGLLVGVLSLVAVFLWLDARDARTDAHAAASSGMADMPGMAGTSSSSMGALTSYAGASPENA